jgi:hypothetical protein
MVAGLQSRRNKKKALMQEEGSVKPSLEQILQGRFKVLTELHAHYENEIRDFTVALEKAGASDVVADLQSLEDMEEGLRKETNLVKHSRMLEQKHELYKDVLHRLSLALDKKRLKNSAQFIIAEGNM